jgi:2-polyprenyl-3-methyl-5-hydroxy-6-metoxy-1,4-benzoquinol methylase
MTEWIERVDRGTTPAILNEHVLRYAFAMPLVRTSAAWADLGCGTGAAAAAAAEGRFGGRLILADNDAGALAAAQRELQAAGEVVAIEADLTDSADLDRLEKAIVSGDAEEHRCITCFEVVEHLDDFGPLIDRLVRLAEVANCTVCLSVPNDAFTGVENPFHETVWGEASVEELRSLLPETHVAGAQYALTGSCIQIDEQPAQHRLVVDVAPDRVPSHYLLVFGPRTAELRPAARIDQIDLDQQRTWERQREADLDYYRQWAEELAGHLPADRAVGN